MLLLEAQLANLLASSLLIVLILIFNWRRRRLRLIDFCRTVIFLLKLERRRSVILIFCFIAIMARISELEDLLLYIDPLFISHTLRVMLG